VPSNDTVSIAGVIGIECGGKTIMNDDRFKGLKTSDRDLFQGTTRHLRGEAMENHENHSQQPIRRQKFEPGTY
jgi:hypothetical protein